MKNFFQHQEQAHRNTRLLLVLMVLAVLGMGLSLYLLLLLVLRFQGGLFSTAFMPAGPPRLDVLLLAVAGTAIVVVLASAARSFTLRGGGARVAEMLGGRLVSGQPRDALEKRLVNVVEEMAIASAMPVPQVFVLDGEAAINAFAAGHSFNDAAVAVTRGALEKLTRAELQGVIAHEFSHVRNGDMRLNMRLMGVVFGIVCIGLFGRLMLRLGSRTTFGRKRGGAAAVLLLLGVGVMVIGYVGELFGKLIKAAIGRQREFLADASAVQFTRNPSGIAGALKKIGGFTQRSKIESERAEEASHLFFADIHASAFALGSSLFATHPDLDDRIARIEPGFRGEYPKVADAIAQPADDDALGAAPALGFAASAPAPNLACDAVVARVGEPQPGGLDRGRRLLAHVPAELRAAIESPFTAVSVVYALLLSEDPQVRARQADEITALSGSQMRAETERWLATVRALPRRLRLPLTELLSPALHALSERQSAALARTMQALIDADRTVSVFEHVLAETVRGRIAQGRAAHARARVRHKSLAAVQPALQLCLSLLARAAGPTPEAAERAFAAATARLPGLSLALLPAGDRLVLGLSAALAELRALTPALRENVIDAAAHGVLADQHCGEDESTLLSAVCDALDCPLPPWA